MPALEEGNLWIRGTAPLNISLERHAQTSAKARAIMATYPEVESVVNQLGRPDDATDTAGYENSEYFVPLRAGKRLAEDRRSDRLATMALRSDAGPHQGGNRRGNGCGA